MLIAFELSGEHSTLPASEVLSCLEMLNIDFNVLLSLDGCLIVDIQDHAPHIIDILAQRLSMTHHILEVLGIGGASEEDVLDIARTVNPVTGKTYNIRVKRVRDYSRIDTELMEHRIGGIFHMLGSKANLKNPQVQFRVLLTEDKSLFGKILGSIDRGAFDSRKPHYKPFFYPGVLMPRVARALVNISKAQTHVLDPFCGTGGILVEAGLIGIKVLGGDMQRKLLLGAKMNLDYYNVDYSLMYDDACHLALCDNCIDAVVTDPPYGRSTSIKAESIEDLLRVSLTEIFRVLKRGKRAVFVSERNIEDTARDAGFRVVEVHVQRVHRSLTRRITVLEKA